MPFNATATEKEPKRICMGCLDSPFFFATEVITAKRPVNAQPSSDIGASPQPTRRGPNQGFWPMIGVIRIQDHRARGRRQQCRAHGGSAAY